MFCQLPLGKNSSQQHLVMDHSQLDILILQKELKALELWDKTIHLSLNLTIATPMGKNTEFHTWTTTNNIINQNHISGSLS